MPSPIEKLQKFLKLETERGYDNRAVVGGLDKFLPTWEAEAKTSNISEDIIQAVAEKLGEYPQLDPSMRADCLEKILTLLQTVKPAEYSAKTRPEPAENPSEHLTARRLVQNQPPRQPHQPIRSQTANKNRSIAPVDLANTPQTAGLNAPLTVLQGIGPKHAQTLQDLGLKTLGDLLYNFPRRYDDYSQLKPINRLEYGEELTVVGTVQSAVNRPIRGGQSSMIEVIISDGTGFLRVNWFNNPWILNKLTPNTQVVLSGKIDRYLGRMVMTNPDWELIEQEHLHTNRIVPVYPLTARVTARWLRRIMHQTVTFWAPRVSDWLPTSVRKNAGLVDLATALSQAHFPGSMEKLKAARERLAFDEIFLLQMGVLRQKRAWRAGHAEIFTAEDDWLNQHIARLPFTLTNAQQKALAHIREDLACGSPMNRLVQGDVGSGKTVVAALAVGIVANQAAQSAFMAPTSILAEQHFRSLQRILTNPDQPENGMLQPAEIALLVGDTSEAQKEIVRAGLADGSIKLVIGTHALIEDPVIFQRLRLVIVDEQHRFGVGQRAMLRAKGDNPHLLVMTATPIPRSLALTVYGDLDVSVMDEMPAGRQPVETHVLAPTERERAYHLINTQIRAGHQAFIIYPLVEKGERDGDENRAAVDEHERLQTQVFKHTTLGLLHGRMKPEEKEAVMTRFRDNEVSILVSTSVVEVGMDVPNATVMLIEGANRFGLAQLHQFRGRVGRGQDKSYCLLIPASENALDNERLMVMAETNDGFVLAERDLQQRGPGEFLGTRQSGFAELKMANITDVHLIEKAREQAQALFAVDPELTDPDHQALAANLERFWAGGRGDIS